MVAVTYGVAHVPAARETAQTPAPRKPWYVRYMDALVEARMQQARREIAFYLHHTPYTLDEDGNRLVKTRAGDMPFGGW